MQALITRALVGVASVGALVTASLLSRSEWLPGTDAYAYVVQARVLVERGHLQFDDGALVVHGFVALLSRVLGSFELAVGFLLGIAAWLPLAAVAPSVARLAHDEGAPRRAAFVALYATLSPTLFFAAIEVPRQAIAFALVPLWIEAWRHHRRVNAYWLALLASVLVHRMMLVPALLFVVAAIVWAMPPRARKAALVVPVLMCALGLLLIARIIIERGFGGDFGVLERALLCAPILVLCLVPVLKRNRGLSPANPVDSRGGPARPRVQRRNRRDALLLIFIAASVLLRPFAHPHTRDGRDLAPEARAVALLQTRDDVELVVARRPLALLYTATTGRDAFLFEPEEHWDPTRITRVVHGVSSSELATYLPGDCTWERVPDSDYALVRDDCSRIMRAAALAANDEGVTRVLTNDAQNPSRRRPEFLRKRAASSSPRPNDPFTPAPTP